jgi:uncharacterized protein (TIGR02246 family)
MKADEDAIRRLSDDWASAVKAKDLDRILDMVTDDVVFLPPGAPEVRGKPAVAELYSGLFARFNVEQTPTLDEVRVAGEWAFAWGADEVRATPVSGGPATHARGKAMTILRRGIDGAWRFARGINNMMAEARPATVH